MRTRDELLAEALRQRTLGSRTYYGGRLRRTTRVLARATRLASVAGPDGIGIEDDCRFWLGAALHGQGRLAEALAAWAPTVTRAAEGLLTADRYMAMTRYLLVAVDLPLPLSRIEAAFEEVEARLRASPGGGDRRRSRVLLARTRLALRRGEWAEGLSLAQEGVQRVRNENPSYAYSAHYRPLIEACLRVGELDLIPGYLEEWDAIENAYPYSKRLLLTAARVRLQIALANAAGALAAAESIETGIHRCEEPDFQTEAGDAFVRACLAAGVPQRGRSVVARLSRNRHCAIASVRYRTRLLLADFHLGCLETMDPGDPTCLPLVYRASAAVVRARREGEMLDSLLESARHTNEVDDRAARLAQRTLELARS